MACPFFEPRELAASPQRPGVRLPLLNEYAGVCNASGTQLAPAVTVLAAFCNQGYAYACPNHPSAGRPSAMRYSVTSQTELELTVTWIEEQAFTPLRQGTVRFEIVEGRATPTLPAVMAAQLTAFCRSYLIRYAQQQALLNEQNDNL